MKHILFTILLSSLIASTIALIPSREIYIEVPTAQKTVYASITAYSHIDSCHNPTTEGCLMANGKLATEGYVACPRDIPLGTEVLILGKRYECGDRLARGIKDTFDIWFGYGREAYKNALEFGRKHTDVVILK